MVYPVYNDPLTLLRVVDIPVPDDLPPDGITDVLTPEDSNLIRLVFGAGSMRKYVDVQRYEIPRISGMIEKSLSGTGQWLEKSTRIFYIYSEMPCSTTFLILLQCIGSYHHWYATPVSFTLSSSDENETTPYGRTETQRRVCLAVAVASMADYLLSPKAQLIRDQCWRMIDNELLKGSNSLDVEAMGQLLSLTSADMMADVRKRVIEDCARNFCEWRFHDCNESLESTRPDFRLLPLYNASIEFKVTLYEVCIDFMEDIIGEERVGADPSTGDEFCF